MPRRVIRFPDTDQSTLQHLAVTVQPNKRFILFLHFCWTNRSSIRQWLLISSFSLCSSWLASAVSVRAKTVNRSMASTFRRPSWPNTLPNYRSWSKIVAERSSSSRPRKMRATTSTASCSMLTTIVDTPSNSVRSAMPGSADRLNPSRWAAPVHRPNRMSFESCSSKTFQSPGCNR